MSSQRIAEWKEGIYLFEIEIPSRSSSNEDMFAVVDRCKECLELSNLSGDAILVWRNPDCSIGSFPPYQFRHMQWSQIGNSFTKEVDLDRWPSELDEK